MAGEMNVREALGEVIASGEMNRVILSKGGAKYKKVVIERVEQGWKAERFTDTQAFHEVAGDLLALAARDAEEYGFRQIDLRRADGVQFVILVSKKGRAVVRRSRAVAAPQSASATHNREKNYLIKEGEPIAPLVDMGVFTKEGKVVRPMYDKFRQINRFLEIINDECKDLPGDEPIKMIDFGCGKSYLTFVVYHYFAEILKRPVEIVGLDLKRDVIAKCSEAARRYGYDGLRFEVGDIADYAPPFAPDIVMTLHACDTATDFALANAVNWGAKLIFSVPCCQHELNAQISADNLSILTRYGLIKERFSALLTDVIRANVLEYRGYRTQVMEFIEMEHTPKNLLIRASKRPEGAKSPGRERLAEAERAIAEFGVEPTIYRLLVK